MIICAGCDRPILDRYLLNVLDRVWHTRCVTCSDCSAPLTEKCFSRDGKLFCKNDFFIRFGTKCDGCTLGISPSDLVRKAKNKVFHLKCFTCLICQKELSTGEELYILDENRFICKDDYIASKLAGSDVEDDVDYECEKEADIDDLDNKNDLYNLQNSENDHMNSYNNNRLNNQFNDAMSNNQALDSTDKFLPPSPIGGPHHLQENGLSKTNTHGPLSPGIKDEPMDQLSDTCQSPGGRSQDSSSKISNVNPGSNCSSLEANDNNNNKDGDSKEKVGNKRRGPRTTIKAKQLELLKASFNSTPKPTRHIREQLAAETGLNMRVIQVWFQNRRSKERRMKQLSALGARRHFFNRSPRRMRPLQPGELEEREMMAGGGYGYFNDNGQDFYPGYMSHGYGGEFFPGQGPDMPPAGMTLLPPHGRSSPPMGMENQLPPHPGAHLGPEAQYLHPDVIPRNTSPEALMHPDDQYMMSLPPRSLPVQFPPHSVDNWS